MKGAMCALLDGQSSDFKPTSRNSSFAQRGVRARRSSHDLLKPQLKRAPGKTKPRPRFLLRSSLDDLNGASLEATAEFRQELIDFAKTAQTTPDPESFHDVVPPHARSAMKFVIRTMFGSVPHQFFDIRYSSVKTSIPGSPMRTAVQITEQCKTLVLSMIVSGYIIKNAQDRMDLTKLGGVANDYEERAKTHLVKGDVVLWIGDVPTSMPAAEYISLLENRIQELEEREQQRYADGDNDPIVEYLKTLDGPRLDELANASKEVLLAMHVCCDEFLGNGNQNEGAMFCTLPWKEMFRLVEWLMVFGYHLRCMEIKHEMERAFCADIATS